MMYNNYYSTTEMQRNEEIMNRIRTVRMTRAFFASPFAPVALALVFFVCTSVVVSVGDVMHNIMVQGEWSGRLSYAYSSLLHSRIIVQTLALLIVISCLMVIRRSLPKLRSQLSSAGHFIFAHSPLKLWRS